MFDQQVKVSLKKEEAVALEAARAMCFNSATSVIAFHTLYPNGWRFIAKPLNGMGLEVITKALLFGYNIEEQTLEEVLSDGIRSIYENWCRTPSTGSDERDGIELTDKITTFVSRVVGPILNQQHQ